MKYLLLFLCLLPFSASAVMLGNCDKEPHEVIIRNGGSERTVTLTPYNGEIQEFGPMVSFQLKGQHEVVIRELDAEYCIWKNKIQVQRLNTSNSSGGGWSLR